MIRVLILILTMIVASAMTAQHTTRRSLKVAQYQPSAAVTYDTVAVSGDRRVSFTGYEKTLRSMTESFFVTNNCSDSIEIIDVEIQYKDMDGNSLDCRQERVEIDLTPGQTRKADLRAWDRQKVFYYYRSPQPKKQQATPYKVSIKLLQALKERKE